MYLHHIDFVITHKCNQRCKHCVDKFINQSTNVLPLEVAEDFLRRIRKLTKENIEVLFLGGEPTTAPEEYLIQMAEMVHRYGFKADMSTNAKNKELVKRLIPYYDWMQITIQDLSEIPEWRPYKEKVNLKIPGDERLTLEYLKEFSKVSEGFLRRSVPMYFTEDFKEVCEDKEVWEFLDTLSWKRLGSYMYAFHEGIRYKKCIHQETNIIDEPAIPKLYPNGNYNQTWQHEEMDDYLKIFN